MMRVAHALIGGFVTLWTLSASAVQTPDYLARRAKADVTVLLDDQDTAADALVAAAEQLGGFFVARTGDRVVARVPMAQLDAYLKVVGGMGDVVERSLKQEDVGTDRAQVAAVVASQEEMLKRYLADLSHAKDRADMAIIESAARELIVKIEQGKGALRATDHDARFASVDVSFKLRNRAKIAVRYQNNHAWLNSVGLGSTLAAFATPVGGD